MRVTDDSLPPDAPPMLLNFFTERRHEAPCLLVRAPPAAVRLSQHLYSCALS